MVLSNKKLKQKIREARAECLVETVSNGKGLTTNQEGYPRLQELLEAAKQSSKLSKREKGRKKQALQGLDNAQKRIRDNDQENKVTEDSNEKGLVGEGHNVENNEEKKKKKRKREEGESKEKVLMGDGDNGLVKKTKNKKKKNKNRKKKAKNAEVKVGDEAKEVAEETNIISESQISEDSATKVYVGGIPYYSTEEDIRSYFEGCGTITEVDCMTFPDSGKFRGIAIIGFKTEAAAKRALALDGSDMGGFFLKIQPYKTTRTFQAKKVSDFAPKIVEGYNRIYVGNLSWDITEEDLRKFFSGCKISSVRWGTDKETGEFRGYGHVEFSDNLSLLMALKLDQQIVCGRAIKISCAVPMKGAKVHATAAPTATGNEADNGELSTVSGKMRRRTCYECHQKGHVSTACPKVLASAAATDTVTANEADNNTNASYDLIQLQ
ncbi:Protein gar2, putative [Ricinus communis]|uniref:Protein gar2, putative n=1 Tax=Ricinus communis TaxID=3988 RepID=B9T163_RICCO|nr:Protein gar2, putative [Ricinus communis]